LSEVDARVELLHDRRRHAPSGPGDRLGEVRPGLCSDLVVDQQRDVVGREDVLVVAQDDLLVGLIWPSVVNTIEASALALLQDLVAQRTDRRG
jgi:hypothetical protein